MYLEDMFLPEMLDAIKHALCRDAVHDALCADLTADQLRCVINQLNSIVLEASKRLAQAVDLLDQQLEHIPEAEKHQV